MAVKPNTFNNIANAVKVAGRRSDLVKKNLTEADIAAMRNAMLDAMNSERDMFNTNVPTIRTSERGLKGILSDGKFKNYMETGYTNGGTGSGTMKHRIDTEDMNFGSYGDKSRRPIYGYMERPYEKEPTTADIDAKLGSYLSDYGNIKFHPKRDFTHSTSTYTLGDSEFDGYYPAVWGAENWQHFARRKEAGEPKSPMFIHNSTIARNYLKDSASREADELGRFIELQYHNGVGLEDIESLDIPEDIEDGLRNAAIESARKYGFRLNETDLNEIVKRCLENCID